MRLYCHPELVHQVLVVENFEPGYVIPWREFLLREYGHLSPAVKFVPAETLAEMPAADGWWTQQVLKLMVTQIIETDRYVALDAKNHLIAPLSREFLESPTGKPRINGYSYADHPLRPALERTLRYVGIDPATHTPFFPRTTTPFTFITSYVQDVIAQVSKREGAPFPTAFISNKLTEFFLYSGYLVSCGKLNEIYEFSQPICPIVWAHTATVTACQNAVEAAQDTRLPFFSIHRRAMAAPAQPAREVIAKFWQQRRLFDSVESGVSFIADPNRGRPAPTHQIRRRLGALLSRIRRLTR